MKGFQGRLGVVVAAMSLVGVYAPAMAAEEEHAHVVALRHGQFDPAEIEVGVGESVTWEHDDGDDPQSVTADDGSFDSHPGCTEAAPRRCMRGGDTFNYTFSEAGSFPYHSRTEAMTGVVTVVEHHDG